jgi:hypothetical protein
MSALLLILGFVPLATLLAALLWPKSELSWGKQRLPQARPALAYRRLGPVQWTPLREPRLVRVTSALTAFLGGMAFPGGFAGVVGIGAAGHILSNGSPDLSMLLVVGLAASVPTGLVIALRCFRLFGAMLENRAGVTKRMRALARFSLLHNVVVALMWIIFFAAGGEPWAAVFATYVLVSFAHVFLLGRSADLMDRHAEEALLCEQALEEAGSSVRVEQLPDGRATGSVFTTEPAQQAALRRS